MNDALDRTRLSRAARLSATAFAAVTSVATFGGGGGWELHSQKSDLGAPVVLSASSTTWTDTFRVVGSGAGTTDVLFDGAVELTPSATLSAPVRVRVRFVPTLAANPMDEATIFLTSSRVFTAVGSATDCDADAPCSLEGSFEVEVLDPAALGGNTLELHWVATGTVKGRGPAAPADASLRLTQP